MMYSRVDSGKGGRDEEAASYEEEGDEEEALVARRVTHADEEASTSGAAAAAPDLTASPEEEDREVAPDEGEGIPLIQIRSCDDRGKDAESGPLSPDQPQCRICLDSGGDDMISPCRCRGTQKFVHRECLDNWRATKEGFAFANCTECRAAFHLRANLPPDRWWLRVKFQLLVLRDHAAIFIVVQLVVGLLGLLVYTFYGDELKEMFGYERHPFGFYVLVVTVALLIGLLYGFFIAIICGQNISNRHYHILAKQELTKEYVVENMNEDEEPPELDSGHINELKMLGLF